MGGVNGGGGSAKDPTRCGNGAPRGGAGPRHEPVHFDDEGHTHQLHLFEALQER
ncbi:MAG: hypothetical protein HYY46_06230 [Deltaproteobacteria bacterium]|nr:hypothetical protein [Deltaproteobacteria bacterium]